MNFRLRSSAKINLSLDILERLPNGYHTLASVVHTIGIWDEMRLQLRPNEPLQLECNRADLGGEDNLCARALHLWNRETGARWGGKIALQKRIPSGAGLGGGSGNAAAMLLALNKTRLDPLDENALAKLGAKLGADVPLFLRGGAILMEGIGEKITPLKPLEGAVLVVKPPISLSTPAVYHAWDEGGFSSENATPALLATFESPFLGVQTVVADLGNDLERAAATLTAAPAHINRILMASGALGAQMSGSGSACFGVFSSETAANVALNPVREKLAKDVLTQGSHCFVAAFSSRAVEFLS